MKRSTFAFLMLALLAMGTLSQQADAFGWRCRWGGCWSPPVCYSPPICYVPSCGIPIIPDVPDSPNIPELPDEPNIPNLPDPKESREQDSSYRAFLYGEPAKLVIGELKGIENGTIKVKSRKGQIVSIAMPALSLKDQVHVVQKLCSGERNWTDKSEQFSRNGKFVRLDGEDVILQAEAGTEITIPLTKLCACDQLVVTHLAKLDHSAASPDASQLVGR